MKKMMNKVILAVLTLLLCLPVFSFTAKADESEEGTKTVEAVFDLQSTDALGKWNFEYNDSWFNASAEQYSHKLATVSFGLAISGFLPDAETNEQKSAAIHLRHFLTSCGFTGLRTDEYQKQALVGSAASVIGHKVLRDEQGEYVLIATGICGGSYGNEWMSVLSCGDGLVHQGFNEAAHVMFDRVCGYIGENQLGGRRLKIWVAGYSRAAGVCNVLAKLLSDSTLFNNSNVFAYTFGTPRTTKDPQCALYRNIFNICGKTDPVSQVVFADWGYERYGTSFYTPAQQMDSDYNIKKERANVISQKAFGRDFINDVEWDTRLRVILNYVMKIMPDARTYKNHVQDIALKMGSELSVSNIMSCLVELAGDKELINEDNEKEANSLLNYIAYTIYGYLTTSGNYQNKAVSDWSSMMEDNTLEVYLSWLFSTDKPEELYSDSMNYLRLVVAGDVDVAIMNLGNTELIKAVKSDGSVADEFTFDGRTVKKTNPKAADIYVESENGQHVILLPKDTDYSIMVLSNKNQRIQISANALTAGYHNEDTSKIHYADMKAGDFDLLFSSKNNDFDTEGNVDIVPGDTFDTVVISEGTSTEWIFKLEKANVLGLSWRQLVALAIAVPTILLAVLGFFVTRAALKHNFQSKKKQGLIKNEEKYDSRPVAAIFVAVFLFVMQELVYWLMPKYLFVRALIKLIIGLILIFLCYLDYTKRPTTLSRNLLIGLTLCIVGDIIINLNFAIGMLIFAIAEAFLVYAFTRYDRLEKWQYVLWIFLSVLGFVIIFSRPNLANPMKVQMAIYTVILSALVASSLTMPNMIRIGALLLIASNIMLFRNEVTQKTLLSHVMSLGVYYIAVLFFAFSSRYKELKVLSLWNEDALSRQKLIEYMKAVTDHDSKDYIPIENRIAVFDLDGTLFSETDPYYFDYTLLVHRVLEDPDYIDKATDFEKEVALSIKEASNPNSKLPNVENAHGKAIASSFAGMTIGEFNEYIQKFKQLPMPSYEGLKRGDGWFRPMLQLIEYLQENAFTVYVVSGTDRLIVRGIIYKSDLNVPAAQIIGSDETIVTRKQGSKDGLSYVFDDSDELVLGGEFLIKNLKMNKVAVIAQEIGTQPVLSFGNSTGDSSMAEYVRNNNPYRSMAFMLCCNDLKRENGNIKKAGEMYELCRKFNWVPISMKHDWLTIFGDNVKKRRKQ